MMNLCKNCKYFQSGVQEGRSHSYCFHPKLGFEPLYGRVLARSAMTNRSKWSSKDDGHWHCGEPGYWFEQKEPEKKTWWMKIFGE
jgi:hypothetical protein